MWSHELVSLKVAGDIGGWAGCGSAVLDHGSDDTILLFAELEDVVAVARDHGVVEAS